MKSTTLLHHPVIIFCGLSILVWLAYANSLEAVFHFDDYFFLINNPTASDLSAILDRLFWPFSSGRALPLLTFYVNQQLHGQQVWGYHFFNILLHAINAFLVFRLVLFMQQRIYRDDIPKVLFLCRRETIVALLTASLFACHPLLTASVTYIIQRSGQLATTFYLLATLSYLQLTVYSYRQRKFWLWLGLALLCYWAAFKCKEMALTWILIPCLYELATRLHTPHRLLHFFRWVWLPLLTFVAVISLYLLNATHLFQNHGVIGFEGLWSPWVQFQSMCRALVRYQLLLLLPFPQWMNVDHGFLPSPEELDHWAVLALILHGMLGLLAFYLAKKRCVMAAMGIGWFYITFTPYGLIPEKDLLVEYKAYLPSIGMMLILAEGLIFVSSRPSVRQLAFALVLVGIVVCVVGVRERNKVYQTTLSLWKDAVSKNSDNVRALHNLGHAYSEINNYPAAIVYLQKALQVEHDYLLCRLNLARIYIYLARTAHNAWYDLDQGMKLVSPDSPQAARITEQIEQQLLLREKWYEEGFQEYDLLFQQAKLLKSSESLEIKKDAHREVAEAHAEQMNYQEAYYHYEEALEVFIGDPRIKQRSAMVSFQMGVAAFEQKDFKTALHWLQQSNARWPNQPDVLYYLGLVLLLQGNLDAARENFVRVLELQPTHPGSKALLEEL